MADKFGHSYYRSHKFAPLLLVQGAGYVRRATKAEICANNELEKRWQMSEPAWRHTVSHLNPLIEVPGASPESWLLPWRNDDCVPFTLEEQDRYIAQFSTSYAIGIAGQGTSWEA